MRLEIIGDGPVEASAADRQFVDGWIAVANERIEAGHKVTCLCHHCDQPIEYPGTTILIPGHVAETNEPTISVLHKACVDEWRHRCDEALGKP